MTSRASTCSEYAKRQLLPLCLHNPILSPSSDSTQTVFQIAAHSENVTPHVFHACHLKFGNKFVTKPVAAKGSTHM